MAAWFGALFRSIGAVFQPGTLKNAWTSVTKNWREYICFYIATLVMAAGFWTVALCTEANLYEARDRVWEAYDYHIEVALLDNEQYANLNMELDYQIRRENEYISDYYWVDGDKPGLDGTYTVRILLDDTYGLEAAFREVNTDMLNRVSQGRRDIRFSPLYTFEEDFGGPYRTQFWVVSLVWFGFCVAMLVTLFLIRLDHFRFVYGVYMTFGADFPRLMGVAGGELLTVTGMTALPGVLIGLSLTAALYLPRGVGLHISPLGVLVPLVGSWLAIFVSVWFPMRRMAATTPVRHLAAVDHTALVRSPKRSFFLFGQSFPGKYELYGFWRMRKYYLRLVLSAVFFAAIFVSGLYMAEMEGYHNGLDPGEYRLAYRPADYYASLPPDEGETGEEETAEIPAWTPDAEEAELIRGDVDVFLPELYAIEGVHHAEWAVSITGGYTLSHLLLRPGQLYNADNYVVSSRERASEGYAWAMNNYAYTAVDETWIDNMIEKELCAFEGDPYAVLREERMLIISEDVYNDQTYDFSPGETVIVAVCEESGKMNLITDPKELLRQQIKLYTFRYETYTIAAVARGMNSESNIVLGVTYDDYATLTSTVPARTELTVYMENGTDLDTVRAAEGKIRRLLRPFKDWLVLPTGNYFDAQVHSLKNDGAIILTLAVCLLLVSPMVWHFSQILFYRKRRGEFAILQALGAGDAAFARLHRLVGGVLSGVAFLATVGLACLCNYVVHFTVTTLLPKLHLAPGIHYDFSLSLPALAACVVVSVLCGFLSCEIPYRLLLREQARRDD